MEQSQDGAIGVSELRPVDLALQDENLVSKSEDLCVAGIAGREYPPEAAENETSQSAN